jgi:hypothetical protein
MRKVVAARHSSLCSLSAALVAKQASVKNDLPTALMAAARHTQIHFTHFIAKSAKGQR